MKKATFSFLVALSLCSVRARAQQINFPNPPSDHLTVDAQSASIVTLVNAAGEEMKRVETGPSGKVEIDIREFTEGVYLVKVVKADDDTAVFVKRIAVAR